MTILEYQLELMSKKYLKTQITMNDRGIRYLSIQKKVKMHTQETEIMSIEKMNVLGQTNICEIF